MNKTLYFLFLFPILCFAQNFADKNHYLVDSLPISDLPQKEITLVDSCMNVFHAAKHDTIKVKSINTIIEMSWDERVWPKYNLYLKGFVEEKLTQSNLTSDEIDLYKIHLAGAISNIGYLYNEKSDVFNCLKYYDQALKLREEIGDSAGIAQSLNNLGYVYKYQNDYDLALEFYNRALKIQKSLKDDVQIGYLYNNIGSIYMDEGDYQEALRYFQLSFELHQEKNDTRGLRIDRSNIASVYIKMHNFDKAIPLLLESIAISTTSNDVKNQLIAGEKLVDSYWGLKEYQKADSLLNVLLPKAEKLNYVFVNKPIFKLKYLVEKQKGNTTEALKYFELFHQAKDSLFNNQTQKQAIKQNLKYEFEKQKAIEDLEKENIIKLEQKEIEKQRVIILATGGGSVLLLAFLIFVFNRLRLSREQNRIIAHTNEELNQTNEELATQRDQIEIQKNEIELAHREIKDSILYAKRIQEAILPSRDEMNKELKHGFVLYQPKDVVAGDFFWMEKKEGKVFIAAADCTGHGVPGAMVSVVCSNALTKVVQEEGIIEVDQILNRCREIVTEKLASSGDIKDGMDICIACIDNNESNESRHVEWAGANSPVYIFRNDEIEITKGNKEAVGYTRNPSPFTKHQFKLNKGDIMYLFTDGYADQFGGDYGKKMGYKRFREVLVSMKEMDMESQKDKLQEYFKQWKGFEEQVDDVCVIGIKI